VSETVITDRAEAMFLAPDEQSGDPRSPLPLIRTVPVLLEKSGPKVACEWCGLMTARGPGCESCGSPLS